MEAAVGDDYWVWTIDQVYCVDFRFDDLCGCSRDRRGVAGPIWDLPRGVVVMCCVTGR